LSSNLIKNKTASLDLVNYIKSLASLMKPRVMSLVIFTCAVGLLTSNSNINISDAMIGIILVALGAGAAGCLNMWYESDLDALMTRTCLRPIPTGKINKEQALIFGIGIGLKHVLVINASRSDSYHIFKHPAAPAPNATKIIPIIASEIFIFELEVSNPTAHVNITRDITLGFMSDAKDLI
jgi:hypothetical protein